MTTMTTIAAIATTMVFLDIPTSSPHSSAQRTLRPTPRIAQRPEPSEARTPARLVHSGAYAAVSDVGELLRTPLWRSSQNFSSPTLGEKRSGRAGGWDIRARPGNGFHCTRERPAGALMGIMFLMYRLAWCT